MFLLRIKVSLKRPVVITFFFFFFSSESRGDTAWPAVSPTIEPSIDFFSFRTCPRLSSSDHKISFLNSGDLHLVPTSRFQTEMDRNNYEFFFFKKKKYISVIPFFCEQILDTEKSFQKKIVKISIEAAF